MKTELTPRNMKRLSEFEAMIDICATNNDQCWHWPGTIDQYGYGIFVNYINGYRERRTHRISYKYHHNLQQIPDNLWVLHTCDERQCINPKHLYLGTRQDNTNDMVTRGRSTKNRKIAPSFINHKHSDRTKQLIFNKAKQRALSKTNINKIKHIKQMIVDGKSNREIASIVQKSTDVIRQIRSNKTWQWID